MRIISKAKEIGFCYGVKNAIKIAKNAAESKNTKRPIYLLGNLVHNHHVNSFLENIGIIILNGSSRLEMLDQIDSGTVIFTAHGVSPKVYEKAKNKGLDIIDATCPYVEATFKLMKEKVDNGYNVIFIGKKDHPETESAIALSNNVHVYKKDLIINSNKLCLCHQTTMSFYDVSEAYTDLISKFPHIETLDMICKVTEKRQNEIRNLNNYNFNNPALIIIIGDKTSNNSTKLFEMAKRLNKTDALFIDNISELNFLELKKYNEIFIGSGTSTPMAITNELYELLLNLDNINVQHINSSLELQDFLK